MPENTEKPLTEVGLASQDGGLWSPRLLLFLLHSVIPATLRSCCILPPFGIVGSRVRIGE